MGELEPKTWAADLQQTIYSTMNQLIYETEDGSYNVGFPHEVDIDEEAPGLIDLIAYAAADPQQCATIIIMLMNSLSYWYKETMLERNPNDDPRLHLANLSIELLTKGFGQNVFGDQ